MFTYMHHCGVRHWHAIPRFPIGKDIVFKVLLPQVIVLSDPLMLQSVLWHEQRRLHFTVTLLLSWKGQSCRV